MTQPADNLLAAVDDYAELLTGDRRAAAFGPFLLASPETLQLEVPRGPGGTKQPRSAFLTVATCLKRIPRRNERPLT